jgi:hypothetical protein
MHSVFNSFNMSLFLLWPVEINVFHHSSHEFPSIMDSKLRSCKFRMAKKKFRMYLLSYFCILLFVLFSDSQLACNWATNAFVLPAVVLSNLSFGKTMVML